TPKGGNFYGLSEVLCVMTPSTSFIHVATRPGGGLYLTNGFVSCFRVNSVGDVESRVAEGCDERDDELVWEIVRAG
ncbi:hypothetical protein HDU97_007624, partial [Phlyctochytrium planicorne]